jgi:endonuclease/exonuclease/phosphatase (EEP) superfamily protein YafD
MQARLDAAPARPIKIISWNLLRVTGATMEDVAGLIRREQPDLLLMQEATHHMEEICARVGGVFARAPLPGRIHGPAMWSATPWPHPPLVAALPSGTIVHRVCQILDFGDFAVANVHLSHGQMLNRRQLRRIARLLPAQAAVLGDYNLVGPALLPGFRDVGPRLPTHLMANIVPLRIDRCLVRGLVCSESSVLPRERSDHCPIVVHLAPRPLGARPERGGSLGRRLSRLRGMSRLTDRRRKGLEVSREGR